MRHRIALAQDAIGYRVGRVLCSVLGVHGRSCRGREDHRVLAASGSYREGFGR